MSNYTPPAQTGIALDRITFTHHFLTQAATKGFTAEQIASAITTPDVVTHVTAHPGQTRHCGAGVAVILDNTHAITVYADRVVTPLRPDQANDPAALTSARLNRH